MSINPSQLKGFSLLEILIAMAIMAIMVAFAFPNIGVNTDKLAKQEVFRLLAAIELVRDQSVLLNREFGLSIDEKGYQFLELIDPDDEIKQKQSKKDEKYSKDNEEKSFIAQASQKQSKSRGPVWKAVQKMPGFGWHEFPKEIEVNLALAGKNLFSSAEDSVEIFEKEIDLFENKKASEKIFSPPKIYFLSSGEQNQFSIGIAMSSKLMGNQELRFFRIQGFLTGELKYEGPITGNVFQDLERSTDKNSL
jgi:prepilin-type N-terminal cleavage/methylation domain-containing protein